MRDEVRRQLNIKALEIRRDAATHAPLRSGDNRRRFRDAMLILGQGMTVTRVGNESGRADEQYLPMSGSSLNFANVERMCDQIAATGLTIQLRRQVVAHPAGWQVTDSDFVTVDKVLAQAVAVELDRIDPLAGGIYQVGEHGPEGSR